MRRIGQLPCLLRGKGCEGCELKAGQLAGFTRREALRAVSVGHGIMNLRHLPC